MKIAVGQIFCLDNDRAGNFIRIENAIIEAKSQKADMIVFPESCILGWVNPLAHTLACPIPGKDSNQLCALAKKYEIYLCIGLDEKIDNQLFDSAILIDDEGNIILKHQKINVLPELMSPPYSVGNQINIVQTKFGKIGILICADSFEEVLLEKMKKHQPDLLLIPYGWAKEEDQWPAHGQELLKVVQNVAQKLHCPVIGANLVGQISQGNWAGKIYGGQSVVCNQHREVLKIGKDRDREVSSVEIVV